MSLEKKIKWFFEHVKKEINSDDLELLKIGFFDNDGIAHFIKQTGKPQGVHAEDKFLVESRRLEFQSNNRKSGILLVVAQQAQLTIIVSDGKQLYLGGYPELVRCRVERYADHLVSVKSFDVFCDATLSRLLYLQSSSDLLPAGRDENISLPT